MEEAGARPAPRRLFEQFRGHEGFHEAPVGRSFCRQPILVRAQQVGRQARVGQDQLGRLQQALADVPGPGRDQLHEESLLQQHQVPLEGHPRHAHLAREVGNVQEAAGAGTQERQQPGHFREPRDVRKVPDLALEDGSDVCGEPRFPAVGRGHLLDLGETSPDDAAPEIGEDRIGLREMRKLRFEHGIREALANGLQLALREGPEGEYLHPAGQRIGQPWEKKDMGRPGQQEPAGAAGSIHIGLDGQKQVRHALDLVEYDGPASFRDEPGGIRTGRGKGWRIVQAEILGRVPPVSQRPGQSALSRLAGPMEEDHRSIAQRLQQLGCDISPEHGDIFTILR